jgi:prepilin-type N-terminal cleavage/methylation domain-containing protein
VRTRVDAAAGFTLIEVLLAVVVLACGTLGAAYAVGHVRQQGDDAVVAATARYLVDDGVAWVQSLRRIDDAGPVFGTEPDDVDVDDVDDLDDRVETAPADRGGNAQSSDWQRRFVVDSVQIADPTLAVADGSTPLMRVRIQVAWQGSLRATDELLLARVP